MKIEKKKRRAGEQTGIPNAFLDRFLPEANGEFVKTYLLLLRLAEGPDREISIPFLADCLNVTESDVRRALRYWERMGQLSLTYDAKDEVIGIAFSEEQTVKEMAGEDTLASWETAVSKTDYGTVQSPGQGRQKMAVRDLSEDEDFVQLLYVVQKYLGKNLVGSDLDKLVYWYQELHFPTEVIEYLVETCVNNDHRSMRYIEKVALDWHERGLMTVERAKAYQQTYRADYYKILRAFGVSGRNPAASEAEFMEKWLTSYGFSVDVILEACNRTMAAINKPSFPYADKILKDWKSADVRGKSDIQALDEKRREALPYRVPAKTQVPASKNRFHNFEQRTYDYDALLRKISGTRSEKPQG